MCDRIMYSSVIVHSCLGPVEYVRGAIWNGHRAPVIVWRVELGPSEKPDCDGQTAGHSKICSLRKDWKIWKISFSFKIIYGSVYKRLQKAKMTFKTRRTEKEWYTFIIIHGGDLKPIGDSLLYKRTRDLQSRVLAGRCGMGGGGGGGVVFAPVWPSKNISLLCLAG